MTRQKVKLSFIENESARRSTFKKRKSGLLKKAHELATLCGVPICVLVNSAYDSNPEMWPSREGANRIASQWKMLPAVDKTKKMVNQETFIQQRISKATESWKKLCKENRELEMKELMFSCMSGKISAAHINKNDLRDLGSMIEQYIKDINRRMEILKTNDVQSSSSVFGAGAGVGAAATSNGMPMTMVEMNSSSAEFYDRIRNQIENSLNVKQTNKDLDLNKIQW